MGVGILLSVSTLGQAQPRVSTPVEFEVASVKPSPPGIEGGSFQFLPGGRLVARNATLDWMMRVAYRIHNYQISGGPHWIYVKPFNIEAVPPRGVTEDEARLMLRSLLARRFKLRVHMETQERPVYRLVVARQGAKLRVAQTERPCGGRSGDGHVEYWSCPIARLADFLSGELDRTVFDMTGLKGTFDFNLQWTPDPSEPIQESIFTALQQQLGLQLKPQRGPVEILTIQHVEPPTPD